MVSNLPKIRKEGIFEKIKKWFGFNLLKENILEENKVVINNKDTNTFFTKDNKILVLQQRLKQGMIEISDLTDSELDEMIELYKKQIAEKKNKLKNFREKMINNKRGIENG